MRIQVFAFAVAALLAAPTIATAQCSPGSIEVASEPGRPICGRPVVGLNNAERAQVPSCSAAETLMLADNGIFLCIASDRITADTRPICFDGSNPFGVASGQPRCRRRVALRDPGIDLALTGTAKAFDNRRGFFEVIFFVPDFGQPELGGSMRVTATNLGRNASLPTKLSMHFAPGFRNARRLQFAQPCPSSTVQDGAVCVLQTVETLGRIGNLGRGAVCDVPALGPGASFTCSAGIVPVGKPTGEFRTLKVVATINKDRSQREDTFANNELALEARFE